MALPAHPTWTELARGQAGVLSREQFLLAGGHRRSWEGLVRRSSTQLLLPGVVLLGSAPPDEHQRVQAALLYAGPGSAAAGLTALRLEGLRVDAPVVDVAVPAGRRVVPQPSPATARARAAARERDQRPEADGLDRRAYEERLLVVPHQVAGLREKVHPARSPRRVRPVDAALQAVAWGPSDAAAEAFLCMVVQRRRATPPQLREALAALPALRRRALVRQVLDDLELGVQARGELLLLRLLRQAGLPQPDRLQRPVRTGTGKRYLDAWWERQRVHGELDGAHHQESGTWDADLARSNDVALAHRDDRVLQLRWTGYQLRHEQPLVLRQLRTALLP